MKRKTFLHLLISSVMLSFTICAFGQKDTVISIEDLDVDKHLDWSVVVKGLVTQYTPARQGATAYYIIKGDYGRPIQVNTSSKKPIINRKYRVKGIVKADMLTDQPYIVEKNKRQIIPIWVFIAAGAILGALLILLLIILIGGARKSKLSDKDYDESFKTVKIVKDIDDPTLVYIDGKLKILTGEDKGKALVLAGYPTSEGGVMTIGKREETGVRRNCHIRLLEKTVSRYQAELIYYKHEKKVLVKNLSNVNNSQVNGKEMHVDEAQELKFGDILKTGEIEFEYIEG